MAEASSDHVLAAKPKRSRRRRALIVVGLAVTVVALLVLLAPTLLSMAPGRSWVVSIINKSLVGRVEIDQLSLAWFGGQRVQGLRVYAADDQLLADVNDLRMPDASLSSLAMGSRQVGRISIDASHVELQQYADGQWNFANLLKPGEPDDDANDDTDDPQDLRRMGGQLSGSIGELIVRPHTGDPLVIRGFSLEADASDVASPSVKAAANAAYRDEVGQFNIELRMRDALTSAGQLQLPQAGFAVDVSADLPTAPAGDFVSDDNAAAVVKAIGPRLTLALRGDGNVSNFTGWLDLDADGANIHAAITGDRNAITIRGRDGQLAAATITADLWRQLTANPSASSITTSAAAADPSMSPPQGLAKSLANVSASSTESSTSRAASDDAIVSRPQPTLREPVDITLATTGIQLPRRGDVIDWTAAAGSLSLAFSDIRMDSHDDALGVVALEGLRFDVTPGESPDVIANATLVARAVHRAGAGDANVTAVVRRDAGSASDDANAGGSAGAAHLSNVQVDIAGRIDAFATGVFDALFNTDGLIATALGPELNANASTSLRTYSLDQRQSLWPTQVDVVVRSQQLDVTIKGQGLMPPSLDASGARSTSSLVSSADLSGSRASIIIDPALLRLPRFVDMYKSMTGRPTPPSLDAPVTVALYFTHASHPWVTPNFNLARANVRGRMTVSDTRLNPGADMDPVGISAFHLDINAEHPAEHVELVGGGDVDFQGRKGRIDLTARLRQAFTNEGVYKPQSARPFVRIKATDLPAALVDGLAGYDGMIAALLGSTVQAEVSADLAPAAGGWTGAAKLIASAPQRLDVDLAATVRGRQIVVTQDRPATFRLTPAALAAVLSATGRQADDIKLVNDAVFTLHIDHLDASTDAGLRGQAELALRLGLDQLKLDLGEDLPFSLADVSLTLPRVRLADPMLPVLTGRVILPGDEGKLHVTARVEHADASPLLAKVDAEVTGIPVALVDRLAKQGGLLPSMLGERFQQIRLQMNRVGDVMALEARVASQQLDVNIKTDYRDGQVGDITGKIELGLTPTSFESLLTRGMDTAQRSATAAQRWRLVSPAKLTVDLTGKRVDASKLSSASPASSASPVLSSPLAGVSLVATLTAENLPFRKRDVQAGDQRVELRSLRLGVKSPDAAREVTLDLTGDLLSQVAGGAVEVTPLRSNTTIWNPLNAEGSLDVDGLSFQTETDIDRAPVALVDAILKRDGELVDSVGETAHLVAVGRYPGDLDVRLIGPNASIPLKLHIDDQRVITLRERPDVSLILNRRLSGRTLKYITPVLKDATGSESPMRLTLDPESFRLPMKDFDINNATIAGEMQLGVVSFDDSPLLSLLNTGKTVAVSTTPVLFHLDKGKVATNDFWLHVGRYRVGIQGEVTLATKSASLVVGLPGATLGLSKDIGPDTVVEVRTHGPIDQLKLDLGELVKQNLGMTLGKLGPEAAAAGKILDLLGGKSNKVEKATLPWTHIPPRPNQSQVEDDAAANDPAATEPPADEMMEDAAEDAPEQAGEQAAERGASLSRDEAKDSGDQKKRDRKKKKDDDKEKLLRGIGAAVEEILKK